MFNVYPVDEDAEQLAVEDTDSNVTIVVEPRGEFTYKPLYGFRKVIGFSDPEPINLPDCFSLNWEALDALVQWERENA